MDMSKYKDLFVSEAREHLQGISNCILLLEKDDSSTEGINELFRHAHSVKGMSASMGYGKISEISHRLEDMMDKVRRGETQVNQEIIDILFEGVDYLEGMVSAVESDSPLEDFDTAGHLDRIQAVIDGRPLEPVVAEEVEKAVEGVRVEETEEVKEAEEGIEGAVAPVPAAGELTVSFSVAEDSLVPSAR